jgi:hypothetical protein
LTPISKGHHVEEGSFASIKDKLAKNNNHLVMSHPAKATGEDLTTQY